MDLVSLAAYCCCVFPEKTRLFALLSSDALKVAVEKAELDIEVRTSGCLQVCKLGLVAFYSDDRTWYTRVNSNVAETIVNEHLVKGNKVIEHCYPPKSV